jgi:hypothetical protein
MPISRGISASSGDWWITRRIQVAAGKQTLKQHRKAMLELEGRTLKGSFEVSLTNQADRENLMAFVAEIRKQLREFDRKTAVTE